MNALKGVSIGSNVLKFAFGLIGVILSILIIAKWNDKTENVSDIFGYLDFSIKMVWVALIVCIAVAVLFGIFQFVTNIGKNKGGLIGLIAFGGILALSFGVFASSKLGEYMTYRGDKFVESANGKSLTETWFTVSEGGLWAVYILIGLAVLAALVSEVTKFFK